jgi:hypothetical protein
MGGVSSSELGNILDAKLDAKLDNKLKSINDKLDAQGATIRSLSSGSGDGGSCDLSQVTSTLNTINDKIDAQDTTISSLSSGSGDGGSCNLTPVSNTLGTIDGKLNNIISGINGLNDNIIDSYYYITDQNSNIAHGLNLESRGVPGGEFYSVAAGGSKGGYNFSVGCATMVPGRDTYGWCQGPQQLFGLCEDQNIVHRRGDNSVLGNYPIKSSDKTCHLQN